MEWVFVLRWAHILGGTVLLGTGAGIAFFMLMAYRSRDARVIAHTAETVVIADFVFTLSAVVVQPVTGLLLADAMGWSWLEGWVVLSIAIYVGVGLFWLPVVWIQIQLRDLARAALAEGDALPERYHRLYRIWFWCGFPAFAGVLVIIALMVVRPDIL